MNITSFHACLAECPLGWSVKEGSVEGSRGAGVSSQPPRGLRVPGCTPVALLQAGGAVGRGQSPKCPSSGSRLEIRLQDLPTLSLCSCTASTVAPTTSLVGLPLAPEPRNLAGKDKYKPCGPTPMDLITRQRFPGQRLDFRIWQEEQGMVCLPGGPALECTSPLNAC